MILNRLGKKTKIAHEIYPFFKPHNTYIEPFFGGGGLFFSKPKAKYNVLNDLCSDVINLFKVLTEQKDAFYEYMDMMPIHEDLLAEFKANEYSDPIKKAARFIFLSNYTFLGRGEILRLVTDSNAKKILLNRIEPTYDFIKNDCIFTNKSFDAFLNSIRIRDKDLENIFVYADPPYIGTKGNYNVFKEQDTRLLFETLVNFGSYFALSEFDNEIILDLVSEYKLEVKYIGERQNLNNRRTEILVTNYKIHNTLF